MKALVICIPLLLLLLICPVTALAAEGDIGTDGYFRWKELPDGTVEVTGYTGPADVIIPGELSGHSVSGIGQEAFRMDSITSVTMPDSVRTIGNGAFVLCFSLSTVTFGNGLEQIGESAFFRTGLVTAALPDSLVSLGSSAFYQCMDLAAVTFGSKLKSIGAGAFGDCDDLTSATFPDSLETIGAAAFNGCGGLSTVVFGKGLVSIGDIAFLGCPVSSPLTFPDSLQTIGESAFYECTGLNFVAFGNGLVSIGNDAFALCGITSAALPDSLETIGDGAFGACASLESVTFGSRLKSIGAGAFAGAPIRSAVLPDSLLSIGDTAFNNCTSLGAVTFGSGLETIGQWAFTNCSSLTAITLPAGLATLGPWAFYECDSLVKVTILSESASLHVGAFLACPMTEGIWGFGGSTAESTFGAIYSFHYLFAVSFDTAGGTAVEDAIVEDGDTLPAPDDPTRAGHLFTGWYADEALTDPWDFDTDTVTEDTTLYAGWMPVLALAVSPANGSIYVGGRVTITPNIARGTWGFDAEYLSREGNTFTGLKAGTARVTYTAGIQSAFVDVTITQAELPATGQDFTAAMWLLAVAVCAGGAATLMAHRRRGLHEQ